MSERDVRAPSASGYLTPGSFDKKMKRPGEEETPRARAWGRSSPSGNTLVSSRPSTPTAPRPAESATPAPSVAKSEIPQDRKSLESELNAMVAKSLKAELVGNKDLHSQLSLRISELKKVWSEETRIQFYC